MKNSKSKIILGPNNFEFQKFGSNKIEVQKYLTPKKLGPKSLVETKSDIVDIN